MAQYIVTAKGYYKQILNPGDVFEGEAGLKGSWFEALGAEKAAEGTKSELEKLTIAELRIMAQAQQIEFNGKTTKAQLAAALSEAKVDEDDEDLA